MAQGNWEADKMLDVYIYDYLMKRNLQATAKAFMAEGKVAPDPVAIDAPGGFLFEWWSVFWDIFIARTNEKHSSVAAAYFESQQMKAKELQLQQYQQLQRQAQLRRDASHPALNGGVSGMNTDALLGASAASPSAGHLKNMNSMDAEALLKSATNFSGQLLQGNTSLSPQNQGRNQQTTDTRPGPGIAQRSLPMDPSSLYGQGLVQGKSGLGVGFNQGVSGSTLLNGLPVAGNEQLRSGLGQQVQRPFVSASNQYQVLSVQQQQILAQAQPQGNFGNSHGFGDMDPRRFRALPKGGLSAKDGQPTGNDSSIGSPMQPSSPMVRQDQAEYTMKFKTAQMQPSSAQQSQEQLQQQHQLQQNNRKRKPTSSGAANSTGTGNTVGPSSSQPSTPSTNTAGDGVAMGGNVPHVSGVAKSSMIYGTDAAAGLASSSHQMDDLVDQFDEDIDSFLNDGDARDIFASMQSSSVEQNVEASNGKVFGEIGCNRTSNNKVLCCHFSSDAKLLASAGHEKKVFIWNMGTLQTENTPEEHTLMITDIRFRPDSTQLATSSVDRTVRLWNAAEPNISLHTFSGHSSQVTSLDFHPKKTDLLCSCDDIGEIRLWNVSQYSGSLFYKGGAQHVRFQPRIGQFLAAATENVISIFDFETKRKTRALQGHNKAVQSVCWDQNGEYLASISPDAVKVWSLATGDRIYELNSNGNSFSSCVFHPTYSGLLILGGFKTLQLWNMLENKIMAVHGQAHEGLITSLAHAATGAIASASQDTSVKLWNLNSVIQK